MRAAVYFLGRVGRARIPTTISLRALPPIVVAVAADNHVLHIPILLLGDLAHLWRLVVDVRTVLAGELVEGDGAGHGCHRGHRTTLRRIEVTPAILLG